MPHSGGAMNLGTRPNPIPGRCVNWIIISKCEPKPAKAPVKKVDLSFIAWEHKGVMYITNDRGDVVNPDDGTWVGRFDGTDIDETVPEPSDLQAATMRE